MATFGNGVKISSWKTATRREAESQWTHWSRLTTWEFKESLAVEVLTLPFSICESPIEAWRILVSEVTEMAFEWFE